MQSTTMPIHVCHIIHQLATGGLENGLVNIINGSDPKLLRHSIICMTDYDAFRERIVASNVEVYAINKSPLGNDRAAQLRVYRLLKKIQPDIVHTRNLTALDAVLPAFFARVKVRIHGEHGRDMHDPDGTNKKIAFLKRLHRPFIHHFTAVSEDLATGLTRMVGVPRHRISHIVNGVNLDRFLPIAKRRNIADFSDTDNIVFGTVGRLQDVKEQWLLLEALALLPKLSQQAVKARLIIVGDGPMRSRLESKCQELNLSKQVLFAGKQDDVPHYLAGMDVFCLPSRAEGISNTLLEAMATGLPIIATRVGGNPELIKHEQQGELIPCSDAPALARAMAKLLEDMALRKTYGQAAYERAHHEFALSTMIERYTALYQCMQKSF